MHFIVLLIIWLLVHVLQVKRSWFQANFIKVYIFLCEYIHVYIQLSLESYKPNMHVLMITIYLLVLQELELVLLWVL